MLELYYCYSSYICLLEKGDQKVNKILLTQMKDIRQGIYTKDITLGESTASLEVALDTDHIKSVKIVPLDESITTMYPLMEPAVKSVSNQLAAGVAPEEVELTKESKYTQQIIVDAVEEILEEQGAANQTVK